MVEFRIRKKALHMRSLLEIEPGLVGISSSMYWAQPVAGAAQCFLAFCVLREGAQGHEHAAWHRHCWHFSCDSNARLLHDCDVMASFFTTAVLSVPVHIF